MLCLTPTPISSDIPNKVFVDQALAEMHTENTVELSQILRKTSAVGGGPLGGSLCRKYVASKMYHQLDISQKIKKNKKKKKQNIRCRWCILDIQYANKHGMKFNLQLLQKQQLVNQATAPVNLWQLWLFTLQNKATSIGDRSFLSILEQTFNYSFPRRKHQQLFVFIVCTLHV